MPTYEYQCTVCGHRFEKFQSFSADPIKECPVCGEPVKKVISPAGIIFKGSGWYINDSKKTNAAVPAASTEKKSDGEASTDKAASTSTEKTEKTEAPKTTDSASSASTSESKPAKPGSSKVDAA